MHQIYRPDRAAWIGFALLMATFWGFRFATLGRAFEANSESTACAPLLCTARNFVRYGPAASRFAGVMNTGHVDPANWKIYAHHPPLVPLLIAGVQRLAGVNEWSSRLVPSLFSIGAAGLLYWMAYRRFGLCVATVAGIFYAFCPMTLIFGGMPDYVGSQLVFFGLAAVECYARWHESKERRWLGWMAIFFVLGALSDWPIFYLVPLLAGHRFFSHPSRRTIFRMMPFLAGAGLVFTSLVVWHEWAGADVSIFHQIQVRMMGDTDGNYEAISAKMWFKKVILSHQGYFHTWPMILLALIYIGGTAWRLSRRSLGILGRQAVPLLLAGWGILHLFVGIQGNYQHIWWSIVLTPGLALGGALGLEMIYEWFPRLLHRRIAAGILFVAGLLFILASLFAAHRFMIAEPVFEYARKEPYGMKELGLMIRSVAAEDEGVLTSDWIGEPALWFYADRQLRPYIMSVDVLNQSLAAGPYVLPYGYRQPNGPPPRWFVMPVAHYQQWHELAEELDRRFPRREMRGFMIFDLRAVHNS